MKLKLFISEIPAFLTGITDSQRFFFFNWVKWVKKLLFRELLFFSSPLDERVGHQLSKADMAFYRACCQLYANKAIFSVTSSVHLVLQLLTLCPHEVVLGGAMVLTSWCIFFEMSFFLEIFITIVWLTSAAVWQQYPYPFGATETP